MPIGLSFLGLKLNERIVHLIAYGLLFPKIMLNIAKYNK